MKPFLEVFLGQNPELKALIRAAITDLQKRHGACIMIRDEEGCAKILDSQSNRAVLAEGEERIIGFLAGYSHMADSVRALVS